MQAYGLLVSALLVLSGNQLSAYVMQPNGLSDTNLKETAPVWEIFFDLIFIEGDQTEDFAVSKCFAQHRNRTLQIYQKAHKGIHQCFAPSSEMMPKDLERHFQKHLTDNVGNCKYEADNIAPYWECSADALLKGFSDVSNGSKFNISERRACIFDVLKQLFLDSRANNKEMRRCMLSSVCNSIHPSPMPPVNTTSTTTSTTTTTSTSTAPPASTTTTPAENSSTRYPWENVTLPPWLQKPTRPPGKNTTVAAVASDKSTPSNDGESDSKLSKMTWGNIASLF